jgi:nucleoside 2-deoxyribosyltransferase
VKFDDGSMAIQPEVGFMIAPLKPRAGFEEDIPNFTLMAASPQMLDALDDCVIILDSLNRQIGGKSFAVRLVLDKARAAITKAGGAT